jgi:hypothetical protein
MGGDATRDISGGRVSEDLNGAIRFRGQTISQFRDLAKGSQMPARISVIVVSHSARLDGAADRCAQ